MCAIYIYGKGKHASNISYAPLGSIIGVETDIIAPKLLIMDSITYWGGNEQEHRIMYTSAYKLKRVYHIYDRSLSYI